MLIGADRRPPALLAAACALAVGTAIAEFAAIPTTAWMIAAWLAVILAVVRYVRQAKISLLSLLGCLVLAAAARWTILNEDYGTSPLKQFAEREDVIVRLRAKLVSVPAESEMPGSLLSGERDGQQWRTRFLARCYSVRVGDEWTPLPGLCRVSVDGRAAKRCGRGDLVAITGRLSLPRPIGNPGEFDFATFLRRRGISGLVYVDHAHAIHVERSAGALSPGYWLTHARLTAQQTIERSVRPAHRALALALLLGDRSEVRPDTQTAFVSSGTMHLLAISGLHIGILCALLLRIFHLLLIPWTWSLLLVVVICILYAFVTDLRPSVVRATLFVTLFAASQVLLRGVPVLSIIGLAAVVMIMREPHLVFDTGAWLSFLSVIALAHSVRPHERLAERDRRPVALTWSDDLADSFVRIRSWLLARYYPMLWILAATIPLTIQEFHVVSPVSLLVNVLLIPVTAVALWLGFATLAFGWLVPGAWNIPALAFSGVLEALMRAVDGATRLGIGHAYLADMPEWFLPLSYLLLTLAVVFRRKSLRRLAWLGLILLSSVVLFLEHRVETRSSLRCTILDVGHGSAAVIEYPDGRVMLVDAGAMNRGSRAGETVSQCLWNRGHRMINSILVSHADVDHFNGLDTVLSRFPVGQLLVSREFIHNESPVVGVLLRIAQRYDCPVRLVTDGESLRKNGTPLDIFQASLETLDVAESDNEKSLVVQLTHPKTTICLPGDLEGRAMNDVLPRLTEARVLISPHHGSLNANSDVVAKQLKPSAVVVSARDADHRPELEDIYPQADLFFTSEVGAVTIEIQESGHWTIEGFRRR